MAVTYPTNDPRAFSVTDLGPSIIQNQPNDQLHEYRAVRGRLLAVNKQYDDDLTKDMGLSDAQIKAELIHLLAEEMLRNDVVQFTKQQEPHNYRTTYRAYLYVTPRDETELIRQVLKDNK